MTVNIKEEAMNLRASGKGTQEKLHGEKKGGHDVNMVSMQDIYKH